MKFENFPANAPEQEKQTDTARLKTLIEQARNGISVGDDDPAFDDDLYMRVDGAIHDALSEKYPGDDFGEQAERLLHEMPVDEAVGVIEGLIEERRAGGRFPEALGMARALGMTDAAGEIADAWKENWIKASITKFEAAKDAETKLKIMDDVFMAQRDFPGAQDDERIRSLFKEAAVVATVAAYEDRKLAKSGDAFRMALPMLRAYGGFDLLAERKPATAERIRREIMERLETAVKDPYERRTALADLQTYMDSGIIDFEKDTDFIERVTSKE